MIIKLKNFERMTVSVQEIDNKMARILVSRGLLKKDYVFDGDQLFEDGFFVNSSDFQSVLKEVN